MSLRSSIVQKTANLVYRQIDAETKNIRRYIGHSRLDRLLNFIDNLAYDNVRKNVSRLAYPENVTSHYAKWHSGYDFNQLPAKNRAQFIRSSVYDYGEVFKTIRFASTITKSKVANSMLASIFNEEVIANIALTTAIKIDTASRLKYRESMVFAISKRVYQEREKWVTGQTVRSIKMKVTPFADEAAGVSAGVYLEMYGGKDPLYIKRMDWGTFNKDDIPTIKEIYGWIKRRKSVGKWRKLAVPGWKWRNPRDHSYEHKKAKDMYMDDGMAAFIINLRMRRRFDKSGRLAPFGSFAKYNKRNTIYPISIFSEIFRRYIDKVVDEFDKDYANNHQGMYPNDMLEDINKSIKSAHKFVDLNMVDSNVLGEKLKQKILSSGIQKLMIDEYLKTRQGKDLNDLLKKFNTNIKI